MGQMEHSEGKSSGSHAAPAVATFLMVEVPHEDGEWTISPDWWAAFFARATQITERFAGQVVKGRGEADSMLVVFRSPVDALCAATEYLAEDGRGIKIAIHHGSAFERDQDYFGSTLNRCARIKAAGHPGQILISQSVKEHVEFVLPPDVCLVDLGLHRLRDLTHPERLYQVNVEGRATKFPPLRSLDNLRHKLPFQLTSFVGRQAELTELSKLLQGNRLITLTGAGGCGKTRLAVQLAADRGDEFPDGAILVELAAIHDFEMVERVTLHSVGLIETRELSHIDDLVEYFESLNVLLIFDNCEHLIEPVAALAKHLLERCSKLRVIATSRRPLGLEGEQIFKVSSLGVPSAFDRQPGDLSGIVNSESVAMFLDRAFSANPTLKISNEGMLEIAEICRRLDGIPLAIELAAPLLRVLPPRLLNQRLEDSFKVLAAKSRGRLAQHQTIQATIRWSYELLSDTERLLFDRLAVFARGCNLEAAETVCSDDEIRRDEVIFVLARLEEHSLIQIEQSTPEGDRFRMTQAVHEFAVDKLYTGGDDARFRERQFQWCASLLAEAQQHWQGEKQTEWLNRIELENDNIRGALEWGLSSERPRTAVMQMMCSAARLWLVRGHVSEGRRWFDRVLERSDEVSPAIEAATRNWAGILAIAQGAYQPATAHLERALDCFERASDSDGRAKALANLGMIERNLGQFQKAKERYAASAAAFEKSGFKKGLAQALTNLGTIEYESMEFEEAEQHLLQSLELHIELRDEWSAAMVQNNLGELELLRGNSIRARELFLQSLQHWQVAGDKASMAMSLVGLAIVYSRAGDLRSSANLIGFAREVRRQHGIMPTPFEDSELGAEIGMIEERLGSGEFEKLLSEGAALNVEDACRIAREFASA